MDVETQQPCGLETGTEHECCAPVAAGELHWTEHQPPSGLSGSGLHNVFDAGTFKARRTVMSKIHPTAIVDSGAELADDVEIGPYCVIEPDVKIGAGTRLRSHVVIRRYTTIGSDNFVDSFSVFGGEPQDKKFDPDSVTGIEIGNDNLFREGVTISRATLADKPTRVGHNTMWMAYSHAGHDTTVEDGAILVNGAVVGGHATVGAGAFLSSHVAIHQFTWLGRNVMTQGNSGFSTHVPPFCLGAEINCLTGLNVVGLRRAPGISDEDRSQIKLAFSLLYRKGLTLEEAIQAMDDYPEWGAPAGEFREFVRRAYEAEPPFKRSICPLRHRSRHRPGRQK